MNFKKEAKEIIENVMSQPCDYLSLKALLNSIIEVSDEPGIDICDLRQFLYDLREELD